MYFGWFWRNVVYDSIISFYTSSVVHIQVPGEWSFFLSYFLYYSFTQTKVGEAQFEPED